MPKGILFHGPPGTGKTLAAKAVANESGARFYAQSASAFVEMFAGLGAARIRKLFEEARKNAPSIVFIDELDAVGSARSGHSFNREQDQTLNQLLVELDGFGPRDQVVVMGASNRLQDLDPALLRPGRFDRQILIQPPDLKGRERHPRACTRAASRSRATSTSRRSPGTPPASPAPTSRTSATRRRSAAGRRGRDADPQADFEHAMDRVIAGLQQRRVITPKEKRILAYHEGGHALMAHLMSSVAPCRRRRSSRAARRSATRSTCPRRSGTCTRRRSSSTGWSSTLAGRAAEQVVFGRVTNGAANDLEKVTELARSMVFEYGMGEARPSRTMRADNYALSEETKRMRDQEQARLTDQAYGEALRLVAKHRGAARPGRRARCSRRRRSTATSCSSSSATSQPESRASEAVGVPQVVAAEPPTRAA